MTDTPPSPFHAGEIALQEALGLADRMATLGARMIRDHMPDQHRDFYEQLPFVVLAAVDADGDIWATLAAGAPGFVSSPDPQRLVFRLPPQGDDPVLASLAEGSALGLLGIELHTRRRNRMNGRVTGLTTAGFEVVVEQAFGNCPQYIRLRDAGPAGPGGAAAAPATSGTSLTPALRAWIRQADTFFVATAMADAAGRHVDASHRGGKPGFVRVEADGSLTIPDFPGNKHFNTLGNILLNPRAGLVFPDFDRGDLLHLTGDAELLGDTATAFAGAERLWRFRPRRWQLRPAALPLRWHARADGLPSGSLRTGDWPGTAIPVETLT
ncbi:pyridoxamine 5'-phosphate oxidase family protein [Sandarakinorhabdus rubra]|uniref:pyridoxamine 5'-phosphate oxidase family protein n=1 Tax=Sandarakinorhabdus rubra TaxID=2672568 RepID=UPI0013DD84BD|nr:pyridoxamine 5'-phosphate oxidase family protein [Sandarakinorhabdus rubra]